MTNRRSFSAPAPALIVGALAGPAAGAPAQEGTAPRAGGRRGSTAPLLPADAATQHEITIGGQTLAYTATAGTLRSTDEQGRDHGRDFLRLVHADECRRRAAPARSPISSMAGPAPRRPISISARSGRARSTFGTGRRAAAPSARVADNPDTWLPFTDLVFIDPVGTGWSRATGQDEAAKAVLGRDRRISTRLPTSIRLHLAKIGRLPRRSISPAKAMAASAPRGSRYDSRPAQASRSPASMMVSPVIDFGLMLGGAARSAALGACGCRPMRRRTLGAESARARCARRSRAFRAYTTISWRWPRDRVTATRRSALCQARRAHRARRGQHRAMARPHPARRLYQRRSSGHEGRV